VNEAMSCMALALQVAVDRSEVEEVF